MSSTIDSKPDGSLPGGPTRQQKTTAEIKMTARLPLLVLVGPTAVGKTAVSIELAKLLNGEIISGDSAQIYKYMDIGTAKPTLQEQQGVPHHLVDCLAPDEPLSAALFQQLARQAIADVAGRGHLPLLVGGTGLYVNAVIYDYQFREEAADYAYREFLQRQAKVMGNRYLHDWLRQVDAAAAERIKVNDLRRIIRALEIYQQTGERSSAQQQASLSEPLYDLYYVGLTRERPLLYQRIEERVDLMLEQGLVEEVRQLLARGYSRELISLQALGYKEIIAYLLGECSLAEAVTILKRDTRHFAKRQLTWFRRDKHIHWYDVADYAAADVLAAAICADWRQRHKKTEILNMTKIDDFS